MNDDAAVRSAGDPALAWIGRAVAVSEAAQGVSTPNPPVGAVIVAADGTEIATGHTAPAGGPHAEVAALRAAGSRARGATAYVTLEPCNHTGRTGPCVDALIAAGIAKVVYALDDPNPVAAGGAERLRAAGVIVESGTGADLAATGPLAAWLFRQKHGRPRVTAKLATTLDGRIAAPDGTSQWITGPVARAAVHRERARIDAIIVGTGTALADDPSLTARLPDGTNYPHQPLRVVLGNRPIPADARLRTDGLPTRFIAGHDPRAALAELDGLLDVQVEGGAGLIGAFLDADLIDRIQLYQAPVLLGAGKAAVDSAAVTTLTQAQRFARSSIVELGDDLLITLERAR